MAQFGRRTAAEQTPEPGTDLAAVSDAADDVATYSPQVLAQVHELVAQLPQESDGGGAEAIVAALLSATSIDDLNAPWDGSSSRALAGRRLEITGIHARPSSFDGGTGIFLVAQATDTKSGDRSTFTTSSIATVLQLAMAYKLGMFPIIADVVAADRPTARGFYPIHLRIVAAGRTPQAG